MPHRRHILPALLATILLMASLDDAFSKDNTTPAGETKKEEFDCHNLKGPKDEKVTPDKTMLASPEQIKSCILRGWDPPGTPGLPSTNWRANGGKNPGIKVGGSGGFSSGTIAAPESPPGARRAPASISANVIRMSCTFPPRVKINSSGVQFPKGSCWDFFHELFKDKDGATNTKPAPSPLDPSNTCPAETDTTGAYGVKSLVPDGASSTLPCGGMVPLSTAEMVLNANPTGFAVTNNGSFTISFYRKSGMGYAPIATALPLPRFLCSPILVTGEAGAPQKSVDLTPPISQVITYVAGADSIAVRLQSRAKMHLNYEPPYDPDEPEKYLIIPLEPDGTPDVPKNCGMDDKYFAEPTMRRDIVVQTDSEGCDPIGLPGTPVNNPTLECKDGKKPNANGKCLDANGKEVPAIVKDNWTYECPSSTPSKKVTPVNGMCPEAQGYDVKGTCKNGKLEVPNPKGGTEFVPCEPTSQADACEASMEGANSSCDMVQLLLEGQCSGKTQFGVMKNPNLYYPPGTTATLRPISGNTMLMADTVAGSKYFARGQTDILLQETAPTLVFNEGGQITFKNGSILIMEAPATVNVKTRQITLTNGGQLTTSGGTQEKPFAAGYVYTIPTNMLEFPILVKAGRSITMPGGYVMPTVPKAGSMVPYVRQPQNPPG